MVRIGGSHPPDPGSIPGRGRWPPELRWQSGRLLTDRSLVRSQVVAISFFNVLDLRITIKCRVRILGSTNPWRNGSASDSRPEGWGFKSLWVHSLASRAPLAERSAVNRQVLGSIPSGGVLFLAGEAAAYFWYPHGTWRTSLWPNGQGVGFRSRRLWVRVPPGMVPGFFCQSFVCRSSCLFTNCKVHSSSLAVEHRSYEPGVAGSIPAWSMPAALVV